MKKKEDLLKKTGQEYSEIHSEKQTERSYSEEEVKKIAFDFYYDMSKKMNVPENLISENRINLDIWFEKQKR
jgi:hypothetical protein